MKIHIEYVHGVDATIYPQKPYLARVKKNLSVLGRSRIDEYIFVSRITCTFNLIPFYIVSFLLFISFILSFYFSRAQHRTSCAEFVSIPSTFLLVAASVAGVDIIFNCTFGS